MTFQINPNFNPPKRRPRHAGRETLQPHEAKSYAIGLLREHRVTPLADRVIDMLAVAGVLSESQIKSLIPLSYRSLLRYYKLHLLDRVPTHGIKLTSYGFSKSERLYTLGVAGLVIAEMRRESGLVPTSYLGYGVHRVIHDLLVNEVVIRLSCHAFVEQDIAVMWRSRYEATVHDDDDRPVLEPDALLDFDGRQVVLEYHNEDTARRASEKVRRYERVHRGGHWRDSWQTNEFPWVLVAFTHRAVATGYQEAVQEAASMGLRCRYLGKPWVSFQRGDDPALWQDFRTGKIVNVLTLKEGA